MAMIERLIPPEWREQIRCDIFRNRLSRAYRSISEYRADAALAARDLELLSARGPLAPGAVLLAAVIRNEIARLPVFLAHYRRLGVDRFMVIDNDSDDGGREFLASERDVDLWHARGSYFAAHKGRLWIEAVVQAIACGHWLLKADADEFLVYDGMDCHDLKDLVALLARRGERRLSAPMVDVYGRGPIRATPFPAGDLLQAEWWFDADGYEVEESPYGRLLTGGPRTRAFTRPEGPIKHYLQKYPLSRYDAATSDFWVHRPYPYHWNRIPTLGAFLHAKFTADFPARVERAVVEKQHARRSELYQVYQAHLRRCPDLSLFGPGSRRYCGPQSLIDTGIMEAIDWSAPRRRRGNAAQAMRHRLHAVARALVGADFRFVRRRWRRAARQC
jgi:hypothetical protein